MGRTMEREKPMGRTMGSQRDTVTLKSQLLQAFDSSDNSTYNKILTFKEITLQN